MRLQLVVAAAVLATACLSANADPVLPGTYGGAAPATTGETIAASGAAYTDTVYVDPGNPFCVDCLDFVIQVSGPSSTPDEIDSVKTGDFSGYSLAYAYEDVIGDSAPISAKLNAAGNVVFDVFVGPGDESDPLIIYTDALAYTTGTLTIGTLDPTDPPAFAPSGTPAIAPTPEPASFLLLGTGLLGVCGVVRRRLA